MFILKAFSFSVDTSLEISLWVEDSTLNNWFIRASSNPGIEVAGKLTWFILVFVVGKDSWLEIDGLFLLLQT